VCIADRQRKFAIAQGGVATSRRRRDRSLQKILGAGYAKCLWINQAMDGGRMFTQKGKHRLLKLMRIVRIAHIGD
jgi:hypothetical protein